MDILSFWLQLCVESVTVDENEGIVRFPTSKDYEGWEARFGHASGLPGCAMSNLAYGAHRTNFTDHLPRPNPAAFLVKPSQVFGGLAPHRKAAAVKASEKPEGHKPIRITRKITNITNASSIIIRRSAATAEQVAKASVLPIPQQSPEIGKVNTE